MFIIVPIPLDRDELKSVELDLRARYNASLEFILRQAIESWELLDGLDSPDLDGLFVVKIDRDDYAEWYEASKRLTEIAHRIGQQIHEQVAPCIRDTFPNADVDIQFVRYLPGSLVLNLHEKVDEKARAAVQSPDSADSASAG